MAARRILIYRLGSLGDTVVALPCFHLIARRFPDAERWLLSNRSVGPTTPSAADVLGGSGLVHGFIEYPRGLRGLRALAALSRRIRSLRPELLIFLAEPRGLRALMRDVAFFRASGVGRIIPPPWRRELQRYHYDAASQSYECETERLARCVRELGDARLAERASWDLRLSAEEQARAATLVRGWPGSKQYIACSVGARIEVKDWGVGNWQALLARLGEDRPELGLMLVGAAREASVSDMAAARWRGPTINLCGAATPRETAALLARARLFVGHDCGPMHLAAAMGTSCVAVFSARLPLRLWSPYGDHHRVVYHRVPCEGCALERCAKFQKKCITSITVDEVYFAARAALDESLAEPESTRRTGSVGL
jgi:ADP-heptose:LPS heptosyltransferase